MKFYDYSLLARRVTFCLVFFCTVLLGLEVAKYYSKFEMGLDIAGYASGVGYNKKADILFSLLVLFVPPALTFLLFKWFKFEDLRSTTKSYMASEQVSPFPFRIYSIRGILFVGALVVVAAQKIAVPSVTDSFHFGEKLVPYFQLVEFELVPYLNLIPPHGFVDLMPSAVGHFVNGEVSVASTLLGNALLQGLVFFFGALLIAKHMGPLMAIAIVATFPNLRWTYFLAFIFALHLGHLIQHRKPLGLYTFYSAGLLFFLEPVVGLPFSILAFMTFLYQGYTQGARAWLSARIYTRSAELLFIGLGFLILMWAWHSGLLINMFYFLKDSSEVNLQAYGIPIFNSSGDSIFMLVQKFGFLFIFAATLDRVLRLGDRFNAFDFFWVCGIFLYTLVPLAYSMGRVDSGSISRSGLITYLLIWFVLAWGRARVLTQYYRPLILCSLVSFVTLIWAWRPLNLIFFPKTVVDQEYNRHLNRILLEYNVGHDAYLDLTNNNLNYFYTERKVPINVSSFYMLANPKSWDRNSLLSLSKISFVLIRGKEVWFDGVAPFDRAKKLTEYFSQNPAFSLKKDGEFVFLVRDKSKKNQSESDIKSKQLAFGAKFSL